MKAASGMLFRIPGLRNRAKRKELESAAIPIRGAGGDLPVRFSPNGGAVPGDRAPERWLDVRWDIDEKNTERFPARIKVVAINEPGTLATIAEVIASNEANIQNLVMNRSGHDFMNMAFDLEVWDVNHLNRILRQLAGKSVVNSAERVIGTA
jgi:guanosine-3',5'-bis(diphosphate) 3'-pyrophosphohydrolase